VTPHSLITALAALLALDPPPGVAVHRRPLAPLERDQLPAIIPYLTEMKPKPGQDAENELREYDAAVRIECRAAGEPLEERLEPAVLHVQRTMLTAPPFLDGWALDVEEQGITFDAYERDRAYCAAALDYRLRIAYAIRAEPAPANLATLELHPHLGEA